MALSNRAKHIVDRILSDGRNPSTMEDYEILHCVGCGKATFKEIREDYPLAPELAAQIAAADQEESDRRTYLKYRKDEFDRRLKLLRTRRKAESWEEFCNRTGWLELPQI